MRETRCDHDQKAGDPAAGLQPSREYFGDFGVAQYQRIGFHAAAARMGDDMREIAFLNPVGI